MPVRDRLRAEKLRGGIIIGREVVVLEETTSTNDSVLQMTTPETNEGLVVFAERQTAGRGQRGNLWESAAHKGLWFSILLRPKIDIKNATRLTSWAASVVAETLGDATVKPPNDVYIDDRKVAGVLVEMRAQPNAPHIAILGIGLNVNQTLKDFSADVRERAASLAILRGQPQDRHLLAIELLQNLDRSYRKRWIEHSSPDAS